MEYRPLCACGNTTAINYKKNNKTYYRKQCHKCIESKKKTAWQKEGYIKKIVCEKCGFRSKHAEQIAVIQTNNNYKSVCLNCEVDVAKNGWSSNELRL